MQYELKTTLKTTKTRARKFKFQRHFANKKKKEKTVVTCFE